VPQTQKDTFLVCCFKVPFQTLRPSSLPRSASSGHIIYLSIQLTWQFNCWHNVKHGAKKDPQIIFNELSLRAHLTPPAKNGKGQMGGGWGLRTSGCFWQATKRQQVAGSLLPRFHFHGSHNPFVLTQINLLRAHLLQKKLGEKCEKRIQKGKLDLWLLINLYSFPMLFGEVL